MSITGSCDACHVASGHAPWCMYARPEHKSAAHGISPAQLREAIIVLRDRLDAALKRIEVLERRPTPDGGKLDHETSPPSADGCDRCRGKSVGYYFPPPWAMDKR